MIFFIYFFWLVKRNSSEIAIVALKFIKSCAIWGQMHQMACSGTEYVYKKTRGNILTHLEHTSRHNVLTKHFHMAWLQPDFSLRAKALWVVKWLFLWPPQWSWFPARSYSVSVCVIRSAGISSSHLTEKRDLQKHKTVIPAAWSGTKPWPAYSR